MMYTLKGWHATATLLLVALCRGADLPGQAQQRYSDPVAPLLARQFKLPWEYILRETILKSITLPMPQDAGVSYKRPLDASFYGGPIATYSNDDTASNIVLSRGKVYRLLNGHWMLCQDECVDCEPCAAQRDPLFKWSLQRIERSGSSADSARYELQLTITPQTDDRLHANDFWPNSYVYVMSQQEQRQTSTVSAGTSPRDNALPDPSGFNSSTPSSLENSLSVQHHRSRNPWRLADRDDSIANRIITRNNTSRSENTERESAPEQKPRSMKPRAYRSRTRSTGNPGEESTNQLEPKLILGTDRRGQKHLVHVVPAELLTPIIVGPPYADHSAVSSRLNQTVHFNDTATLGPRGREGHIYQRIFRRVFDSLNAHRRSIEDFFKAENASRHYRTFPGVTNLTGFNWDNRAINHTRANFAQLHGDKALSQFYMGNEGRGADRRQNRGRYPGYEDARQKLNDYHRGRYRDIGNYAETSRGRNSPMNFDWGEERRKMRIKPYYADSRSVSAITPSTSSQQSGNFSADGKPGFGNSFVNGTLIGKANNNSVGPGPITTRRGGNAQLFRPERLKSGDANRGSETSHHPFRIIITTTESPVMRGQHEALNHTKTVRITTLKTVDVDAPRSEMKSDGDADVN